MKRLIVPALALGLAMVFAAPASAGVLDCLHRDKCCEPCKPACPEPCPKPCKPACHKPLFHSCPKPACEPCPKPACDPCAKSCDPCGSHLSRMCDKMKSWAKNLCHRDRCCDPCGGSFPAPPVEAVHEGHTYDRGPRLAPVPMNTSMRSIGR